MNRHATASVRRRSWTASLALYMTIFAPTQRRTRASVRTHGGSAVPSPPAVHTSTPKLRSIVSRARSACRTRPGQRCHAAHQSAAARAHLPQRHRVVPPAGADVVLAPQRADQRRRGHQLRRVLVQRGRVVVAVLEHHRPGRHRRQVRQQVTRDGLLVGVQPRHGPRDDAGGEGFSARRAAGAPASPHRTSDTSPSAPRANGGTRRCRPCRPAPTRC